MKSSGFSPGGICLSILIVIVLLDFSLPDLGHTIPEFNATGTQNLSLS